MPKQPADRPKSKRIQVIKDIMTRWGTIDKKTLTEKLCRSFDCDEKEISRAIYRDLEELVSTGQANVTYYSRDGALIDDFNADIHKNFFCKWTLTNAETKIMGEGLLHNIDASIWSPAIFNNSISIHKGTSEPSVRTRHIYLCIGSNFLCLKVSLEESTVPISFHFSRTNDDITTFEIKDIEELTKRIVIIKIPVGGLSSYKDKEHLGHLLITLPNEKEVELKDLKSSNGTSVYKISMKDAERLRLNGELLGEKTVSESWNTLSVESFKKIDLVPMKKETFPTPLVIQACAGFRVLVM